MKLLKLFCTCIAINDCQNFGILAVFFILINKLLSHSRRFNFLLGKMNATPLGFSHQEMYTNVRYCHLKSFKRDSHSFVQSSGT